MVASDTPTDLEDPSSFGEAMASRDHDNWREAMKEKIRIIDQKSVWILADFPPGMKVVGIRWVYHVKQK